MLALHSFFQIPFLIIVCFSFSIVAVWYYVQYVNAKQKRIYLFLADVFLMALGFSLTVYSQTKNKDLFYAKYLKSNEAQTFIGVIDDLPIEKEKFYKCSVTLLELKTDATYKSINGKTICYIKKSSHKKSPNFGETILFKSNVIEVPPPLNPYEFDYKNYLNYRNIYHTFFIDSLCYEVIPNQQNLSSIWQFGLEAKSYVITVLRNSNLSQDAFAICAALITGYDDEISKTTMTAFSKTGTLHVLSVSGLHTGLIYLVLNFFFDLIDRKKKYKYLRFVIITGFLWFVALLTGFSAPILRAVVMFNLLGIGKLFFRPSQKNQINILLVSAFLLLLFNPLFIKDIGFLLSYFALFGLMYFQPKISNLWQPENKIINSLWQTSCASVAATLSTLPITLYFFHQFPLWFVVCNIIVVPATFVLLLLAVLLLFKLNFVSYVINFIMTWLMKFINLFGKSNSSIELIDFTITDVLFLSVLIVVFTLAIQKRSYQFSFAALLVLISWQLVSIFYSYESKSKSLISVYQLNKFNTVAIKNTHTVLINQLDTSNYNFHIKPHFTSFNNPTIKIDNYNFINYQNLNVLLLNKKNFFPVVNFKLVNTLVIANNFKLKEEYLQNFTNLKQVVVDGSNSNYVVSHVEKLCRKFGYAFYNTKQNGAYIIEL
ncbi:MAG: ComEC/Rec2 family competence protein [Bacteroidota bacterium]|nr:ComEC/Rec2 family competence protein [Bacteroidota bacterium]